MDQKYYKIVAILIILVLIVASVSAFVFLNKEEKKEKSEEIEEEFVLDDRISPYTNQGLHVEILRIRNRDLLDRMLTFGTSWRDTPRFYYTIEIDYGIESKICNSKGHLGEDEVYVSWDTFGKYIHSCGCRIFLYIYLLHISVYIYLFSIPLKNPAI